MTFASFKARVVAIFNLFIGRRFSMEIFEMLYWLKKDPWNYRSSQFEQAKYRETLRLLPPNCQRALELGCAEGIFTDMLAQQVGHLTAVDFSATALERSRTQCSQRTNIEFLNLDIKNSNPTGQFDVIVASEVLYYVGGAEEIRQVGRRLLECLSPGGYLLLCHIRTQSDEKEGLASPSLAPSHPGAFTVHAIFESFPELVARDEAAFPKYVVKLFQLAN